MRFAPPHSCFRYERGALQRRQAKVFDPLLHWARQELGWELHTSDSIAGTTQPSSTVAAVQDHLQGEDPQVLDMQQMSFPGLSGVAAETALAALLALGHGTCKQVASADVWQNAVLLTQPVQGSRHVFGEMSICLVVASLLEACQVLMSCVGMRGSCKKHTLPAVASGLLATSQAVCSHHL